MRNRPLLIRLYAAVLRLMPAEYRERYGHDSAELLSVIAEEERPSGKIARIRWAAALLLRGLAAALGMRWDRWRRRRTARRFAPDARGRTGVLADARYIVRSLRAAPWYTLTIVAAVAVPMTMASTTFAIVDGVLFKPLPYPSSHELVALQPNFDGAVRLDSPIGISASPVDLTHWHAALPEVPMTGYRAQPWGGLGQGVNDTTAGVALIEQNFFDVLGAHPLVGGFSNQDFNASPTVRPVIATYDVWQNRFQGADILGREIITDRARGVGVRIVGIMPRGFAFPSSRTDVSFLSPFVIAPDVRANPRARMVSEVIARLPAGMTNATLQARLRQAASVAAKEFPAIGPAPKGWSEAGWRRQGPYDTVDVQALSAALGERYRPFFEAVFGAVALLVIIAGVNISSLMAARALDRRPQMDIRRSLGAGATAISRLWLIESITVACAGGLLALIGAPWLLRVMNDLLPETVLLLKPAVFDWRVGTFVGVTLCLLASVIAIAPIRRSLKDGSSRGASTPVRTWSRFVIVGAQVSAALVLTVLGSMLVSSLLVVYADRPPIHTDGVIAVDVMLSGAGATMELSPERAERERLLREQLVRVPGVRAVSSSAAQVLRGGRAMTWFMAPPGRTHPSNIDTWPVSEGFYDVLEPQFVAGRAPSNAELRSAAPVIVVSELAARAYWPDSSPVGQTLTDQQSKHTFTVVGVVREIKWSAWDMASPVIYAPYQTTSRAPWMTFLLRTDGRTGEAAADAVRAIDATDHLARPTRAGTLDEWFRESVSLRRFQSWLFGSFAVAALLIVGTGILGLLAMSAARRTREVGIRCALGATPNRVMSLMLREQLTAVIAGLVVGVAVAAWAIQPLRSYLYRVEATDARVWLTAIVLVLVSAATGTLIPAIKASRTDPLRALRQD